VLYVLYLWISSPAHGWVRDIQIIHSPIFRAALTIMLSFLLVLAGGSPVIRWLITQKIGDRPESHNVTLNELTKNKTNTPTMGGILIIGAIFVSIILFSDITNFYVQMSLLCLIYLAALGAVDDWLKLTTARRTPGSRDGLLAWEKLVFQIGLGVILAVFIYHHPANLHRGSFVTASPRSGGATPVLATPSGSTAAAPALTGAMPASPVAEVVVPRSSYVDQAPEAHKLNWPFFRDVTMPLWPFVFLTVLVITGTSNAVNLTDGMDGLAAGCMAIVSFAFLILAYITGDGRWSQALQFTWVQHSGELAVVCGALTGACLGFLWFNCNPAQVFMGDTGSLALGGTMGYVAIVIRQEPMLLLVGGIFVIEALSVITQVSYFRMTGGKRIFLCSPIHHHFHLKGWSEQQVVVRFWLISALCAAFGLATVKLR